jgi:hypothetical protein
VTGAWLEQVALGAPLAAEGLIKAGGKQRTDSTHVVAAVAAQGRLELAGKAVRAALRRCRAPRLLVMGVEVLDQLGAGGPQRDGPGGSVAVGVAGVVDDVAERDPVCGHRGVPNLAGSRGCGGEVG